MKTTISKILILLVASTLTTSCMIEGLNRISGNRKVTTENRKVAKDFTAIQAGNGIEVLITQSNQTKIVVEADENLQDYIKTEVQNGVLKIYSKRNIWRAKSKRVYVSTKTISAIKAASGSDVYTENTIKANNIDLSTSSGADAKISINATTVTSSASSGSDLKIIGKAKNYSASASSGSSINAYGLESLNATVKVSSGADIDVYVLESLDAKASSGGDVDFKGNPKRVRQKASSGGSVSEKN
ncbi:head GIN domain-containing protein [Polaribacter pacificus]|nr:head GIN domain-containing protein [Polaribacter pacificus]